MSENWLAKWVQSGDDLSKRMGNLVPAGAAARIACERPLILKVAVRV